MAKEKECEMCLHPMHKGECRVMTEYGKELQKQTGKKRGRCGCFR